MNRSSKMTLEDTIQEIAKFHFILDEGRKGHHLLFSPNIIRKTFEKKQEELLALLEEKMDLINEVLNHSFSLQSFEEKRNYISTLPSELQCALVFGYFQLLDGELVGLDEFELETTGTVSNTVH